MCKEGRCPHVTYRKFPYVSQSVRKDAVLGDLHSAVVLHDSQSVRQDDVLGVTYTVVLHGSQSVRQDDVLGVTYTVQWSFMAVSQ